MAIRLRRLTAREHYLCAPLLAFVLTFLSADVAVPRGDQLRMAGHTTIALLEIALPLALFVPALLVFLPRTGNESRFAFFRFVGRFPLVIRYFAFALLFSGIQAGIEKFFDLKANSLASSTEMLAEARRAVRESEDFDVFLG